MSGILYYSNFCEHSKNVLKIVSKTPQIKDDIHFMCIDKRMRDPSNGKTYLLLENGQKIVLPENITKVPALLLINDNFKVLYGDLIYEYLKPVQATAVKQATNNNFEPLAFSLGNSGIVSDHYSFLDMDPDSLNTKGNGGLRQMHSYVGLNENYSIPTPGEDFDSKQKSKIPQGMTVEQLQQMRDSDISSFQPQKQGLGQGQGYGR
jgi:hypothetical protein